MSRQQRLTVVATILGSTVVFLDDPIPGELSPVAAGSSPPPPDPPL